jgi:hypothetical protein
MSFPIIFQRFETVAKRYLENIKNRRPVELCKFAKGGPFDLTFELSWRQWWGALDDQCDTPSALSLSEGLGRSWWRQTCQRLRAGHLCALNNDHIGLA